VVEQVWGVRRSYRRQSRSTLDLQPAEPVDVAPAVAALLEDWSSF
jgi:hypothetical protein